MVWITEDEFNEVTRREVRAMRDEIRRTMREKHLRINAISKGTGIAYCAVRDFVKGTRIPSYKTISRIRLFVKRYTK